jgi:spore germination protein
VIEEKNAKQPANFSNWQQTSMITSMLIGVGVLTLPRSTTEALKEAGWMATILGGLVSLLLFWLMSRLSRRFPGFTLIQFSPLVWGSRKHVWLGKVLSFPWVFSYLGYLYVVSGMATRVFGEVVVTAVLLETPLEAIVITMFMLAFILCLHDVEVVARVNEILFPLIVFPVLFIAIASFQKADWNNLFPLFRSNWQELLWGTLETSFAYLGYEIMLIYFAFAHPDSNKVRAGFFGIGLTSVIYTLIVLAGITVFGSEELQKLTWPTLELVKTTQVPGLILERLESAFLGVWVAAVFTSVATAYYTFIYGLRQYLGRGMTFQRVSSFILLIPLFYITFIPENIIEIFQVMMYMSWFGLGLNFALPIVYLLVIAVRGMFRRSNQRDADA